MTLVETMFSNSHVYSHTHAQIKHEKNIFHARLFLNTLSRSSDPATKTPPKVVFPEHITTEWVTAVSVFAIGGSFGAILAGTLYNKKGRQAAITVYKRLYIFGGVLSVLAPSIIWLLSTRFLVDFACR